MSIADAFLSLIATQYDLNYMSSLCSQQRGCFQTFYVDLSGGVVCSEAVGGHAGVASRVVLEGLCDHQRVQVTIPPDLDVGRVVQLTALAEPPGHTQSRAVTIQPNNDSIPIIWAMIRCIIKSYIFTMVQLGSIHLDSIRNSIGVKMW